MLLTLTVILALSSFFVDSAIYRSGQESLKLFEDTFNYFSSLSFWSYDKKTVVKKLDNFLIFQNGSLFKKIVFDSIDIRSNSGRIVINPTLYCSPATVTLNGCRFTINIKCRIKKWC